MKKIISMIMVVALIFACSATAFATSYSSTISMSAHSTLAGATRSYVGTSHNISLKLSSKDEAGDNFCKVTLNRVNLTSTVSQKTVELNLKTVGNKTVIVVTHSERVLEYADNIFVMNSGVLSDGAEV